MHLPRGRSTVRESLPVDSAGIALSQLTISEDSPAHVDDSSTLAEQETKESFESNPSPASLSLPSVTQPCIVVAAVRNPTQLCLLVTAVGDATLIRVHVVS